jgi:aspartyl-tRNA(Asn)/glutamyl-tRNA(Gln) amidotransferase subunit A
MLGIPVSPDDAAPVADALSLIRRDLEAVYRSDVVAREPVVPFAVVPGDAPRCMQRTAHATVEPEAAGQGPLTALGVAQLAALLRRRDVSPVDVTRAYLERIAALDGRLHAFITVTGDRAISDAERAEGEIRRGNCRGILHGVPVAHKDMFRTKGIRTTYGSKIYQDFVPTRDDAIVERFENAGTVLLGKLNTYELGTGDSELAGRAANPWDVTRTTGGSSSGSACAVAADLVAGATGGDGGGSLRGPAAFCGAVTIKPTFGRVSSYHAEWNTTSVFGPITKTVLDAAILLQAMAGHDPRDPSSVDVPVPDYPACLTDDLRGVRVGVLAGCLSAPIDPEVASAFTEAVRVIDGLGATVMEVELPHAAFTSVVGTVLPYVENHTKRRELLVTRADDLNTAYRRVLTVSQFLTAGDYTVAQRARGVIIREFARAHETADVIVTPAVPFAAARFDELDATVRAQAGRYVRASNVTGLPAAVIPCGFTRQGLPISLQIMGRAFEEVLILQVAHAYERATPWHTQKPELA